MLSAFTGKHVPTDKEHHKIESILESLVDATSKSPNGELHQLSSTPILIFPISPHLSPFLSSPHLSGETLGHFSSGNPSAISPALTTKQDHGHWWKKFFTEDENRLDDLFAENHLGNYVAIRGQPGVKIFETMPIYVRVGMHLLFSGSKNTSLLKYKTVAEMLKSVSVRQGKVYDDSEDPESVQEHIKDFIKTYGINLTDLEKPDPAQYATFNEFFYRKLAAGQRPIAEEGNNKIVSSSADCRLAVFNDSESATKTWIKGKKFDFTHLVGDASLADREFPPGSSIAIFRLAPADYHRYHHGVGPAVCGPTKHVDGEYYTVNPQAVNGELRR